MRKLVTAKEMFDAKKLAQKYGIIGKVAGLYRIAGHKIDITDTNEEAEVNFIASKRNERLGIKVFAKNTYVPVEVIEKLRKAADENKFKPILVLYGTGPKLKDDALNKAKELEVSLKRVRPQ